MPSDPPLCPPRIIRFLPKNEIVFQCPLEMKNILFIITYMKTHLTRGKMHWTQIPWRKILLRSLMGPPASA